MDIENIVKQLKAEIEAIRNTLLTTQELLIREIQDTETNQPRELTGVEEENFIKYFCEKKLRPNVVEEIKEKDAVARPDFPKKPEGSNKGIGSLWIYKGDKYELKKKGAYKMFTKVGEEGMKINDIYTHFKDFCVIENCKVSKRDKLKEVLEIILKTNYNEDKIFNVSLR